MRLLCLILALAIPVWAAPLPTLNPEKPIEETRLLRESEGELQLLELPDVLGMVEERHPKLLGANLARGIASAKVLEKQGAFDPSLGVASTYQRYNSSSSPGKPLDYISNGIVVAKQDPSGIKWEGGWLNTQGFPKSPASSSGDVGEFFLQAKVPFLRGAGINEKSIALEQARLVEEQTLEDYQAIRLLTLLDAGMAYLQWNAAVMQWRILDENQQLAIERATQVAARIEAGDLAAID
ncbi:MAG: TolC family protein, partial [Candidatus Eremiobacteraeota bacterium]|nr:TolC family protein [Candidatus Eremiobacteraeota bacterium]